MSKKDYSAILESLIEYTTTKEEAVKNFEKENEAYKTILKFADIPANIMNILRQQQENFADTGCWIRIAKPKEKKETAFPLLSDVLELWADKESLKDEYGTPKLKQSIFVNGKTILSTSYPQIEKEFKDYVRDKWLDDLIKYKELLKAGETKMEDYKGLAELYEKLEKLYYDVEKAGEDFELVAGSGLLCLADKGIKRYLLTHKAEISLDTMQKEALIEIKPDIESPVLIETDMLAESGIYYEETVLEAEKKVYNYIKENNITDNIFDVNIKEAIKCFAENLDESIEYAEDDEDRLANNRVVSHAPALLLRRKIKGGITTLLENIVRQFENTEEEELMTEKLNQFISEEEKLKEYESNPAGLTQGAVNAEDNRIRFDSRPDLMSMTEFLVFTTNYNVYKVQNKGIRTKLQILEYVSFEAGDRPIYVTGTRNYSGYIIAAYENGKIGKIQMESYKTEFNRKMLKNAYNNESPLVFIEHIEEDTDLVAISNINKVILFNTRQINPVGSKTTKGFQVMKSKDGSYLSRIKKYEQVKFQDPTYYRRDEGLNVVGFYLKAGDEV